MTSPTHPFMDSLPKHIRDALDKASTSELSALVVADALRAIYSISLREGPQLDALTCALESHTLASQLELIKTILKGIRLADPHSHFLISALGQRIAERADTTTKRLETLLTLFPT